MYKRPLSQGLVIAGPPSAMLLPALGAASSNSHEPEFRLPADQDFPETVDLRHLQLDLLRHHGRLCHGDDVQLTCTGRTRNTQDVKI